MKYQNALSARQKVTPQTAPIRGRESEMVLNNAGGFVFTVSPMERLRRFLILGSSDGTYYVNAKNLTLDNIDNIITAIEHDGPDVVSEIVHVSKNALAPRNDPALYALAVVASYGTDPNSQDNGLVGRLLRGGPKAVEIRAAALAALNDVARTGTHIMQFAEYVESLRGWGRALRRAVADWFNNKNPDTLALQAVKYRQRNGWTLRDLLRLSHAEPRTQDHGLLFDWIAHSKLPDSTRAVQRKNKLRDRDDMMTAVNDRFQFIAGFNAAASADKAKDVAKAVRMFNLPHECVPSEFAKDKGVLTALSQHMPMGALIRNLNRLSAYGVFDDRSIVLDACERLTDETKLQQARIHPFSVLLALNAYKTGKSRHMAWCPLRDIADALDAAFYAAFRTVEPADKDFFLALDVSGSMGMNLLLNTTLNARTASAAMALVTMATEKSCFIGGFSQNFRPLSISPRQRLDDVVRSISDIPFGATNASAAINYAMKNKISTDVFVIYTDNETWSGKEHVSVALQNYRQKFVRDTRLVSVGMTATEFSVVDPKDVRQMNVVGFDAGAPGVISQFARSADPKHTHDVLVDHDLEMTP
jgi:60 kDa SS-A/Ro ribonucleoprotein